MEVQTDDIVSAVKLLSFLSYRTLKCLQPNNIRHSVKQLTELVILVKNNSDVTAEVIGFLVFFNALEPNQA